MLEVKNVTKIYKSKNKRKKVVALDNVSISFPEKGLVTFIGESGCGKSTLMNMLTGLDTATEGKVLYKGKDLSTFKKKEINNYRRNEIALVFQDDNLLEDLTVYENVVLPLKFMENTINEEEIKLILSRMSIMDLGDRKIDELSGGQKQRVAIARALVKKPKVILADEPTGSLDEDNAKIIFELLKEISKDTLVIVFTHARTLAMDYADLLYKMNSGTISEEKEIHPIKKSDNLVQAMNTKRVYPFGYLFKTGCSNLKSKIKRLILIIILSAFAFSFFGVCLSTANYSESDFFARSAQKNNFAGALTVDRTENLRVVGLDRNFVNSFNQEFGLNMITSYILMDDVTRYQFNYLNKINRDDYFIANKKAYFPLFKSNIFASISESEFSQLGFSLVGRLPESDFEIAISEYQFESFLRFGYKFGDIEIENKDITKETMLGKRIQNEGMEFTITGIFDTGFKLSEYESLMTKDDAFLYRSFSHNSGGYNVIQFTTENTIIKMKREKHLSDWSGLVLLPKDEHKVSLIYEFIHNYETESEEIAYSIKYFNLEDDIVSTTALLLTIRIITGILSICFAIFAVLFLLAYVNISIKYRKHTIGILRSFGANALDVTTIFSAEVLIIVFINFVLSMSFTSIIVAIINEQVKTMHNLLAYPYSITFILAMYLLGACLLAGIISLLFPILSLNHKKIIDLLK